MTPPRSRAANKKTGVPGDAREAWHRLLQISSRVLRELDMSLDSEQRMTVSEFDVLITLDNAPDRRLRMTDLAQATMLSSGGMTRLVGRLEQRGLVRRDPDPDDARAFQASLTQAGRTSLAQARITHDEVIASLLGEHLTPRAAQTLAGLLDKVLQGHRTQPRAQH
jgi:DNA-binding MarR family transcriptional regulator